MLVTSQHHHNKMSYIRLLFMIQVQILVGGLHKDHLGLDDVIRGHQQVFANNL